MALSKATLIDLNSNELILDLDADTSITADTDDTIHIKIAGSDELTLTATAIAPSTSDGQALGTSSLMFSDLFLASGSVVNFNNGDVTLTHASNNLILDGGSLDLDGESLILDADGDTKIAESSDDVIHLTFAGSTSTPTEFGAGYINLKNQGTQSYIRYYCESSNAHYTQLQAAAHSDYSGNATVTLPVATSTLATLALSETLTNKTLTTPIIAEIDSGSTITLDATTDIVLDADGGDIIFKDGGTSIATFTNSSTDLIIETATSDKDLIFKVNDGGSSTEVMRLDGDVSALLFPTNKEIRFTDANESIKGDGSNLILKSGGTAFTVPASDGSSGQFLRTDGSGTLSFATVSTSTAFDDVTAGDAAVNVTTTAGNITIDAQGDDTDIILKGTDGGSDTTFLTIDGSAAGEATFNAGIVVADAGNIGSASDKDAIAIASDGDVTFSQKVGIVSDHDLGTGLHIKTADSGASVSVHADELVVEGSANSGMSILSGNSNNGRIMFGDDGDNDIGYIEYDHSSNQLALGTSGSSHLKIDSTGAVTKPNQPSALAGVPSEKTNLTGDGSNVVIGSTTGAEVTEIYDKNGDMSSGIFTCPVDGRYLMTLNLFIDEIDDACTDVFIQMESSNRTQYWARDPHEGGRASSDSYGIIVACIVEGDANDTLKFKFTVSGTDKSVDMTDLTTIAVELLG